MSLDIIHGFPSIAEEKAIASWLGLFRDSGHRLIVNASYTGNLCVDDNPAILSIFPHTQAGLLGFHFNRELISDKKDTRPNIVMPSFGGISFGFPEPYKVGIILYRSIKEAEVLEERTEKNKIYSIPQEWFRQRELLEDI